MDLKKRPGRPTNKQNAAEFWGTWWSIINENLPERLKPTRSVDNIPGYWEVIKAMYSFCPRCEYKVTNRFCGLRYIDFNIIAVWYLCEKNNFTVEACVKEMNNYRKKTGNKNQMGNRIVRCILEEVRGQRPIICRNPKCQGKHHLSQNALMQIRMLKNKFSFKEKLCAFGQLTARKNIRYDKWNADKDKIYQADIASNLGMTSQQFSQTLKSVERKSDLYLSERPTSKHNKDSKGKAVKMKSPKEFFKDPSQLEYDANPIPQTRATEKKRDEFRRSREITCSNTGGRLSSKRPRGVSGVYICSIEAAAEFADVETEIIEQWLQNGMRKTRQGLFIESQLDLYKKTEGGPTQEQIDQQDATDMDLREELADKNSDELVPELT